MYTPAHFAEDRSEVLHRLIREYPLATLVSAGAEGIEASHLPMVLDVEHNSLRGHMARANEQWQRLDGAEVLAIFSGPQHYISPSWYVSKREHGKVVPTWNYVAVHVTGRARISHDAEFLLRNVTDLTDHNEAGFPTPWTVADAPGAYIEGLTKAMVGFEIPIEKIEGKWKTSQNRSVADRQSVVENLQRLGSDASRTMAELVERTLK